jgi:DNA integrity scanning protein DisA with diadenylate cyclase activity
MPIDANPSRPPASPFDAIVPTLDACSREVFETVLELAIEIAREGREGRRIGTLFTIGHADAVLAASRPLILDPLAGHSAASRRIADANLRGTIKELAQLDGAFIVSEEGVVLAACRYLNASADDIHVPLGLGSRHFAAASISKRTGAIALVVSESAVVRVFDRGEMAAEVLPELWLLSRYHTQMRGQVNTHRMPDLAILTAEHEVRRSGEA